ncbi:MAG: response regulator transcription factor [Chitinophagaceae bacterium]|nr:response regulator transcription factor [Chitinophagaceae bacterium]
MKVLIIEDERLNANRLQKILMEINPEIEVAGILVSVADSINWLNTHPEPDIILMDIRLSDGLSFDIFTQKNVSCPVIFTTAYDEYAVRAFKANGIDYLLKPVEKEELQAALQKAENSRYSSLKELRELVKLIKDKAVSYRRRFLLAHRDEYKTIEVSDVAFIFSESRISHLVLSNGSIEILTETMDDLEGELDPGVFFRASRQFLITVQSIEAIHNHFNGRLKVSLKKFPDKEVLVSKDKAPLFKKWLSEWR